MAKKDKPPRVPPSKQLHNKKCSATSKRSGKKCENWAVGGARTCRMHGGTHPRGGKAPQASKNLKHGLFAKTLMDEEKSAFARAFAEMLEDPATAMLADAALLRVKAATVASRADEKGMYVAAQSGVTRQEPMLDVNGQPIMYRPFDDSPELKPVIKTTTTISADRRDVIGPVSELLMRAGRLVESAVAIKKKELDTQDPTKAGRVVDRETALAVMRDVFREGGALERPATGGADGPVSTPGPTEPS
jgi:hypothetical protein